MFLGRHYSRENIRETEKRLFLIGISFVILLSFISQSFLAAPAFSQEAKLKGKEKYNEYVRQQALLGCIKLAMGDHSYTGMLFHGGVQEKLNASDLFRNGSEKTLFPIAVPSDVLNSKETVSSEANGVAAAVRCDHGNNEFARAILPKLNMNGKDILCMITNGQESTRVDDKPLQAVKDATKANPRSFNFMRGCIDRDIAYFGTNPIKTDGVDFYSLDFRAQSLDTLYKKLLDLKGHAYIDPNDPEIQYYRYYNQALLCAGGPAVDASRKNESGYFSLKTSQGTKIFPSKWGNVPVGGSEGERAIKYSNEGYPTSCSDVIKKANNEFDKLSNHNVNKECEQKIDERFPDAKPEKKNKLVAVCMDGKGKDAAYCDDTYKGDENKISACKIGLTVDGTPEDPTSSNAADNENTSTCEVPGVGWILCPLYTFMGDTLDSAFNFISNYFLEVSPEYTGETTKNAWNQFKDVANVMFVILLMFVIYAQMSGTFLSNYQIKRILPRLLVVILLVNLSFYICQVAVDISNIAGRAMNDFLANDINPDAGSIGLSESTGYGGLQIAATVATTLVLGGAAMYMMLPLLGATLLGGLVSILMVVFLLLARKVIIMLLIVLSPIAFLTYMLPNTQFIFTKWKKLFVNMLILFPVIGLLFGGSKLAAGIIINSGGGDSLQTVLGVAVTTIPLFATIPLVKAATSALGSVGGTIQGIGSSLRRRAWDKGANSRIQQAYNSRRQRNRVQRRSGSMARSSLLDSGIRPVRAIGHVHSAARGVRNFANRGINKAADIFDGGAQTAQITAEQNKIYEEQVAAALSAINPTESNISLLKRLQSGKESELTQVAIARRIASTGNLNERANLYSNTPTLSNKARQEVSQQFYAKGDQALFGAGYGSALANGTSGDAQQAFVDNAQNLSAEQIATGSGVAEYANSAVANLKSKEILSEKDTNAIFHLKTTSTIALNDENLQSKMSSNTRGHLETISPQPKGKHAA